MHGHVAPLHVTRAIEVARTDRPVTALARVPLPALHAADRLGHEAGRGVCVRQDHHLRGIPTRLDESNPGNLSVLDTANSKRFLCIVSPLHIVDPYSRAILPGKFHSRQTLKGLSLFVLS